jgi:hypothetical protein
LHRHLSTLHDVKNLIGGVFYAANGAFNLDARIANQRAADR